MPIIFPKANYTGAGKRPVIQDRHGLGWDRWELARDLADDISSTGGNFFYKRSKDHMATDFETAQALVNKATVMFDASVNAMVASEERISAASKRTSGNVRKAADDLYSGMQKIEKVANFDRLERAVSVLERAAAALTILSELEKDGKLDRIVAAVNA